MLDLFRSRDTSMRYLLIVLLSLVALSMIVTLIPGFGSQSMTGGDTTAVANICGEKITGQQIAQLVQIQIRNREMSPEVAELAVPQMVNQMVGEMATSCQAKKMGLIASDEEVANGIKTLIPMLWQNGEFAGKEAYQGYLQRMNTTIPQFEARVRQNLMLEKLQRVAFDGIVVSPKEVESEFSKKGEKARIDAVKLDPEEYRKKIVPSRAELDEHYQKNKARYIVPPQRSATLLIADVEKMGAALKPADADLDRIYRSQLDRFKTQDRVKTRHILIKSDGTTSKEDDAKAKARAQDLLNQIRAGGDFAELAKKNSQDPGSGAKGGELDFYPRGQLDAAYEASAYALKPKETSNLVKSQFGYHIIQTIEKETARTKPLDEVRAELVTEYRKSQLIDKIPQIVELARAELLKAPGQAEQIAQKHGLDIRRIEKWTGGGEFPGLGRSPELDLAVGSLPKGGISDAIELPNSRMAIAVLDNITAARPGALNEVEDRVKTEVVEAKVIKTMDEIGVSMDAKLKANGNDLKKAAAELGLKVVDSGDFDRTGQMPNLQGAFFGEQPFVSPLGFVASKHRIGATIYFWKVTGHTPANPAALDAKERKLLVDIVRERKMRERRDLFEEGLVRQLKESGSISVNEDAIKKVAASYRRG